MYIGKSLVYCIFCKGFVHCNLELNKSRIIQSIGFMSLRRCPWFLQNSTFLSKKIINKSIYDIDIVFKNNTKINQCTLSFWTSTQNSIIDIKKIK